MRRVQNTHFLVLISFVIIFSSCSGFQRLRKNPDWKVKYDAAIAYYEEKDFYRASILFEDIIPIIRGTEEAELANFYFAYSYFEQGQYILSAHYFESFVSVYSRSELVMEASYMHAFSSYKQSPEYRLDQTSTYIAISLLQSFINRYPYSDYAEKADGLIDELQVKLEKKAYENAKWYYKIGSLKAALVAFDNFRVDYPDSKFQEEIRYLTIKTTYDIADRSIRSLQKERYEETIDKYEAFIDKYPNSIYLKEAQEMYGNSIEELSNFADQNNL